jgi:nitrogen fixation protein NifM
VTLPPPASEVEAYHRLKIALDSYGRAPAELLAEEHRIVVARARRSNQIQSLIVGSPQADAVAPGDDQLRSALQQIRARYADEREFTEDLARNDLTVQGLATALQRDLTVEALLAQVASTASPVSDDEAEAYYRANPERFRVPETRSARHILITVNAAFAENAPGIAETRVRALAVAARLSPGRFAELASRHSECPTALKGGLLGNVCRGQLYPELDAALFRMQPGEVSTALRSELGFHLLKCEQVRTARNLLREEALPRIRAALHASRVAARQRVWLRKLAASEPKDERI